VLSQEDQNRLATLCIRCVVDLRSTSEREEHPHGLSGKEDIAYWFLNHEQPSGRLLEMLRRPQITPDDSRNAMLDLYRNLPFGFVTIYRLLFQNVLRGALPLVFSCAAGKDRTGVAAALLLTAVGVAWEDVIADYSLSGVEMPNVRRALRTSIMGEIMERVDPAVIEPLFSVDREYLDAARNAIVARCGSVEDYFDKYLELQQDELKLLRELLLEESPPRPFG
jgi:protein-tyrosine phosphatase